MFQFVIGNKKTIDDWGLLLSSYDMGSPKPKTNYVDIPFGNGSIDLTEALTGDVAYENRDAVAKFTMINPRSEWLSLMDEIKAFCHGKKFSIIAPEDSGHYYVGRVTVGALKRVGSSAEFELDMECEPYKYKNDVTSIDLTVGATGTLEATLTNSRMKVIPVFTVSAETQVIFGSTSVVINAGEHTLYNVVLVQGNNPITFNAVSGTTINIKYQEGVL